MLPSHINFPATHFPATHLPATSTSQSHSLPSHTHFLATLASRAPSLPSSRQSHTHLPMTHTIFSAMRTHVHFTITLTSQPHSLPSHVHYPATRTSQPPVFTPIHSCYVKILVYCMYYSSISNYIFLNFVRKAFIKYIKNFICIYVSTNKFYYWVTNVPNVYESWRAPRARILACTTCTSPGVHHVRESWRAPRARVLASTTCTSPGVHHVQEFWQHFRQSFLCQPSHKLHHCNLFIPFHCRIQ